MFRVSLTERNSSHFRLLTGMTYALIQHGKMYPIAQLSNVRSSHMALVDNNYTCDMFY